MFIIPKVGTTSASLIDQFFHPPKNTSLRRPAHARIIAVDRAVRQLVQTLDDHAPALAHLLHSHEIAIKVVAVLTDRHVEIDLVVNQIGSYAAHIVRNTAGA